MPNLLACTDGSTYSPALYRHIAWAALRLRARVEVLHVLDHHRERAPGVDFSGSIGIDAGARLTEELTRLEEARGRVQRIRGKAILEDARRQLEAAGITDVGLTQRHGTLVGTLEELEPTFDLVAIGKRGADADRARGHLGGNLERVVRSAVRPVLVTPETFRPVERFLIAHDGGPSVGRAVEYVLSSPLLRGVECHLLRAGDLDDTARWYLGEAAGRLREAGWQVTVHALPGAPGTVIPSVIQAEDIGLLVMGAYGHSPIRALILGSTTTDMVRRCEVPVLMFR